MKRFYITVVLMFIGAALAGAQNIKLSPSNDMTTNEGMSTMFPTTEQLWIANLSSMQNFHQTMIRFDLSAYAGHPIANATLNLYQYFHAPDGSPTPSKIYAITEEWDENTWPTNTNVAHGTNEYATPNFSAMLGWYSIDIGELVESWLDGSVMNYGLVIIANPGTKFAEFYSKEAGDETVRPYLTFDDVTALDDENAFAGMVEVYPNPVKESATVRFILRKSQQVTLSIHDMVGKEVSLVNQTQFGAGEHQLTINRSDLHRGIWFVRLQTDQSEFTRKLIVE